MAKSFIDQLFDLVGLKLPDAHGHYSPSVYREEQSTKESSDAGKYQSKKSSGATQAAAGLTGVAKYLADKYPEEQKGVAQADSAGIAELTGVAKYLAKKQQEEREKADAEAAALVNMTGVAKYLAKQQIAPSEIPQPVQQAAKIKVTEQKPVPDEKKKTQAKQAAEKQSPPAAKTPSKIVDLAENAAQCQSTTSKGTQCRRKISLDTLEKTINQQKYKFAVCSQHNNKEFTPFAELVSKG